MGNCIGTPKQPAETPTKTPTPSSSSVPAASGAAAAATPPKPYSAQNASPAKVEAPAAAAQTPPKKPTPTDEVQQVQQGQWASEEEVETVDPLALEAGEQIGRGSSGRVLMARSPLGKDIALKVVPIALRSGFEEVVEELVALYQSHHPHVAAFHGAAYNQSEQCMVIAFEYLDRKSLRDVLKTASTIPESIMACASAQVLAGMIYLHRERRLIHRDIKPTNVLVNSKGRCKISDFGMSKELSNTLSAGQTWVGTSSYMSPERVGGQDYTFNADVWGLGILVFECCTGKPPWEGAQTFELLDKIVDGDPPELPKSFSPEARDFVVKALEKDHERRAGSDGMATHAWVSSSGTAANVRERRVAEWLEGVP
mmetsp:Transcript_54886/g.130317  ORF Transcript_54886/g.130317 Transcript_54886/m.130317 type:complete len:369 (+) Transcript_54886:33-1139(+)